MTVSTFDDIKKAVGKNLKRYDDTDTWKEGNTDVTETDVEELINEIYLNDLVPLFLNKFPQDFRQTGRADSWISSGTANAGLTGDTITTTTNIFTNGMVGLYLYNNNDGGISKITAYNAANSVDVQDSDVSSWSGDGVFVLGQEFAIGGEASDVYQIESIGIKRNATDTFYTTVQLMDKQDIYHYGNETGSQATPAAYLTSVDVNGSLVSGIGILPGFQTKVASAIQIDYIGMPVALSSADDTPRIPVVTPLIYGATARGFELKHEFDKANYWNLRYDLSKKRAVARYVPQRFQPKVGIRTSRRFYNMMTRTF